MPDPWDGILGSAATLVAEGGMSELAALLTHASLDVDPGRGTMARTRTQARLTLPPDLIARWQPDWEEPFKAALDWVLVSVGIDGDCTLRVGPGPAAEGWRTRIGQLLDWESEAPGDWWVIEERLNEMKHAYARALTPDDRADIGNRCRDLINAAVNQVFRPHMVREGDQVPQEGNSEDRFAVILSARASGSRHEELRSLLKRALRLAHKVTHDRSAELAVDTFAAAQATILVVRTLAQLDEELNA